MHADFGTLLREWRAQRRMSQLDLGLEANVSARHISFLETGRARPSRQMALHLGEALEMPREARNRLLEAAGFAAAFRTRSLQSQEMDAVRRAAEWTIARHEPYPALALDRHWRVVIANRAAARMLAALSLEVGDSLLDFFARPQAGAAAIENWGEVARHMLARLRLENARGGGDAVLETAIARLAADPSLQAAHDHGSGPMPPFLETRFRIAGGTLSFFSTIAAFSGAEDIALADLRIELLFPADEATRAALEAMHAEAAGTAPDAGRGDALGLYWTEEEGARP